MHVISMDTLETIDFTRKNLEIHRFTARQYQPGTPFYRDLVSKYPSQVALINEIIAQPTALDILKQQFRRFPLHVGKHYRHDGKDRPNQKMACPWRGSVVVVIKHLKSGLYQVRVTKGRFSSDSDLIYTLPKNEFEPIEDEPYDYPEHLAGHDLSRRRV